MENSSHPYAVTVVNYLSRFKMLVVSILVWLCQLQLTVIESASFGGDMQTYPLWGPYAQSSCIGDECNRNKSGFSLMCQVHLAWHSSHHRPVLLVFFRGAIPVIYPAGNLSPNFFHREGHLWPTDILNSSFLQKLWTFFCVKTLKFSHKSHSFSNMWQGVPQTKLLMKVEKYRLSALWIFLEK